jgi:hypothetical protein
MSEATFITKGEIPLTEQMKEELRGGAPRALSTLLLALWVGCALALSAIVVHGGPWKLIFPLDRPKALLTVGCAAFAGWQFAMAARHRGKDRWRSAVANLALLGVSLSLSLSAGEMFLRAYLRHTQGFNSLKALAEDRGTDSIRPHSSHALVRIVRLSENKDLVFELRPSRKLRFGRRNLELNSRGMRESREYQTEKDPSTLRIVGIGDSGMFGWNIEQGGNYLDVLEDSLSRREGAYEVLNLAVPGYNTYQEVESLISKGLDFDPDIVIVGWCNNDFDVPFFLYQNRGYREKDLSYLYALLFDRKRYSVIAKPRVRKGHEIDLTYVDPGVIENTGTDGVRKTLNRLKDLGEQEGFRTLVFGAMNSRIVNILEEIGMNYFNTREEIPSGQYPKEYAIHFIHPSPAGHKALAGHLEERLEKSGWLEPDR